MFNTRKALNEGPRTSMTEAKRFYLFEEVLVRVRQAQAGLISDLLLDYVADQFLAKMRNSDPHDLDHCYETDERDIQEEEMYYTENE